LRYCKKRTQRLEAYEFPIFDTMTRIVALGASNLTRGFQTVVATARSMAGPRVEVVAALGHGQTPSTSGRRSGDPPGRKSSVASPAR
jgi:hypothetical protein